jgi:hypothetical protein
VLLSPEIWYAALASPYGIIVSTDDPVFAKQKLYGIRKGLRDPDLESIAIMTSPHKPESELWLVKRTTDAPRNFEGNS